MANDNLRLLDIHKRRRNNLIEQKAKLGTRADPTIKTEIEDIASKMQSLENTLRRRRQKLSEQLAMYGISADPSISMEIEDIKHYFLGQQGECK